MSVINAKDPVKPETDLLVHWSLDSAEVTCEAVPGDPGQKEDRGVELETMVQVFGGVSLLADGPAREFVCRLLCEPFDVLWREQDLLLKAGLMCDERPTELGVL